MNGNVSADSTSSIGLTNATLNLAAGKTVDVAGRVNSNNGTIAINGAASEGTVRIATLNNTGSTTFRTSSTTASQIVINDYHAEEGSSLSLDVDSKGAQNSGGDIGKAAKVLLFQNKSQANYRIYVAETDDGTVGSARGNVVNGELDSVVRQQSTVGAAIQNIAANNYLVFRSQTNDVSKRMGDLRSMPQADGMWARAVAGQSEYKSIHNTYQTLQIGADKRIGNFYVGGTASYTDGDGKLNNGSTDDKNYSFGLYGGWINNDGQYVDVTIKRHHLETEYDIYNRSGIKSEGSYDTWGTSASVEYGWRLGIADTNYYIEPQAELTIGHLNSVSYKTSQGAHVKQEGIDTTVGRLGIAAGWVSPEKTGSAYLKASILHDWEGDSKVHMKGAGTSSYHEDMGGTWGEFALGGTWNINKSLAAYGEVETTAGNPVRTTYQVSGGIRYSF